MPPAKKRPRSYDPAKIRTAVLAQFGHVRAGRPHPHPRAARAAHPARGLDRAGAGRAHRHGRRRASAGTSSVPSPAKAELALLDWPFATAPVAGAHRRGHPRPGRGQHPDLDACYARTEQRLAERLAAAPGRPAARHPRRRHDARRLPGHPHRRTRRPHRRPERRRTGLDIPYDRQALAACTRLLADALAVKAPGGSTEVRIPPFAVVQCVEGPRHTRGTPPNVVETDPLTWIRLATGRTEWAEALDAAKVSASGERADLGRTAAPDGLRRRRRTGRRRNWNGNHPPHPSRHSGMRTQRADPQRPGRLTGPARHSRPAARENGGARIRVRRRRDSTTTVTGVHWNVDSVTVDGKKYRPRPAPTSRSPTTARSSGNYGCNHFGADRRRSRATRINVGTDASTTEMACDEKPDGASRRPSPRALADGTLTAERRRRQADPHHRGRRHRRAHRGEAAPLDGTKWTSPTAPDDASPLPPRAEGKAHLTFDKKTGTVRGSLGCNRVTPKATVSDGQITLGRPRHHPNDVLRPHSWTPRRPC